MQLSDFYYDLPIERIARYPLKERSSSRLLKLDKFSGITTHHQFTDLRDWLKPGDLLIANKSRVIPARLYGFKKTGGQVELLVERILDQHRILVKMKVSKKPKTGDLLFFSEVPFEFLCRHDDLFEFYCHDSRHVLQVIESIGEIPLPHYLKRSPDVSDYERYQTIFAEEKGSVAAPTAGLHFDQALLDQLRNQKVEIEFLTLHVGAGTFAPVRAHDITQHQMHAEYIEVNSALCAKIKKTHAEGGRVIAVGTTTTRALETASLNGEPEPYQGNTNIFIYPGFSFRCVDVLITNFHLPYSSLLMMVTAFGGYEAVMSAYKAAIDQQYRFYSFGDAMWIG